MPSKNVLGDENNFKRKSYRDKKKFSKRRAAFFSISVGIRKPCATEFKTVLFFIYIKIVIKIKIKLNKIKIKKKLAIWIKRSNTRLLTRPYLKKIIISRNKQEMAR